MGCELADLTKLFSWLYININSYCCRSERYVRVWYPFLPRADLLAPHSACTSLPGTLVCIYVFIYVFMHSVYLHQVPGVKYVCREWWLQDIFSCLAMLAVIFPHTAQQCKWHTRRRTSLESSAPQSTVNAIEMSSYGISANYDMIVFKFFICSPWIRKINNCYY